jgi:hypothetical protein
MGSTLIATGRRRVVSRRRKNGRPTCAMKIAVPRVPGPGRNWDRGLGYGIRDRRRTAAWPQQELVVDRVVLRSGVRHRSPFG